MPARKRAQINFGVEDPMKAMYEEVKAYGNWVTRWCAAGFLLMVEDPEARRKAIARLRAWEAEFHDADEQAIRDFVAAAERAIGGGAPENPPAPRVPRAAKKAKR